MRLTKLGHSCVRLDQDGAILVIDPGGWSDPAAALDRRLLFVDGAHISPGLGWPDSAARPTTAM